MRPSTGETIGSSSDTTREAVSGDASRPSCESIDTSSVERYGDNGSNRYQTRDGNRFPISEAARAEEGPEPSFALGQGFSSSFRTPEHNNAGLHFSHSRSTSPGSWRLSVCKDSLDRSSNPFEILSNSPTPGRPRSSSYKKFGSPSSGNLSSIYEGKQNLSISAPRPIPKRLITRFTPHPDEFYQFPRDVPGGKHISESPESPGSGVFHFSPERDSYISLNTNNPIHIKSSQSNESPSMQQGQKLGGRLHKNSEIPASARDGLEKGLGSPKFNGLEVIRSSPPGPLTSFREFITNNRRKDWEPSYHQCCLSPNSNSSPGQDWAWNTVPSGHHSIFGSSPRLPGSPIPLERGCEENVENPNPPRPRALAKLYASMELDDTNQGQEMFSVYPASKHDLSLRSSSNGGNDSVSNRASVKAPHHIQPGELDRPSPSLEFQASPHALPPGKGIHYPSPNTKRLVSPSNNKIVVGEFVPNFVDKTEKHANLRSEIERILNEPDNPRNRGSPLISGSNSRAENPTLTASLSPASSDALQEALDFLAAQVKALLRAKSDRENPWSKHFPITSSGSIQYMPMDTKTYAFEDCSNLQKLTKCTAVFLDTLTGTSNSGFWAAPNLFITSLRFRGPSASSNVMDYDPDTAPENSRYFVSPSNTGMLEDRVPVFLKGWDTPSNLAIFKPATGDVSQQYIGIENLVEDHELLPTYSSQIYSDDNIAAVGYIHARPKPQEQTESDDLRRRTGSLGFSSNKDTRIRTVCSINQVHRFMERCEHMSVLKANCLFPQNFYGSPCITKQSGLVIGVVNGPHSVSNTRDIKLFPQGFKNKLRWVGL